MEPPSRTKFNRLTYSPLNSLFSLIRLVIRLSKLAANFRPQPLNAKSRIRVWPVSGCMRVMPLWSRAQVSLVSHWRYLMFFPQIFASIWLRTRSMSGATISKGSLWEISRAISIKQDSTSSSMSYQSVPAWGHVSCMPDCGYHSAGSI